MKRKRGSSDDLAQQPQIPSVKPQPARLSHIHVPLPVTMTSMNPDSSQLKAQNSNATLARPLEDQTDRMDWQHAHTDGQAHHSRASGPELGSSSRSSADPCRNGVAVAGPSSDTLRETISTQFSLKIMLKHRELRLIDQEIAKCQIALEQLRRCQLIPYPAMSSNWEEMQAVARGAGPAKRSDVEGVPPWGVTNGPYTRHYRHWLIPDTAFGDCVAEENPSWQSSRTFSDRAVRASTAGKSSLAQSSRSQRGQGSARLKALPHGYPEAKEDKGPMLVKRSTDGQMVKLICLDCRRSDFNSVQGFINHCRIAHSRNFQSHDAAAIACGEEVELDQVGGIKGETSSTDASGAGLVHPLIRSTHGAPRALLRGGLLKRETSTVITQTPVVAGCDSFMPARTPGSDESGSASSPFRPSPQTPHLSALMARIGQGGDLEEAVNLAKTKFDIEIDVHSDDDDGGDDAEENSVEAFPPPRRPTDQSARGILAGSRRPKDGANLTSRVPSPAPSSLQLRGSDIQENGNLSLAHHRQHYGIVASPNLSPNTVEAHQAPSLISDDDEFENTHSECSSGVDVAEDLERHYFGMAFENQDEQAMEDIDGAGNSAGASHLGVSAEVKGSPPPRRSSAMRSPDAIRDPTNNERHVSFASPMQKPRKKGGK
ncbi:MAG: hypothetical protein Q9200_006336 [Gallowayella weberi]